jgi:acylphosphatase
MNLEVRRLRIRGRVQGVYYRASMVEQALQHGALGWVRNRRDGSVEAVVVGDSEVVARMIAWARIGPSAAVVEEVLVEEAADEIEEELTAFLQLPTL